VAAAASWAQVAPCGGVVQVQVAVPCRSKVKQQVSVLGQLLRVPSGLWIQTQTAGLFPWAGWSWQVQAPPEVPPPPPVPVVPPVPLPPLPVDVWQAGIVPAQVAAAVQSCMFRHSCALLAMAASFVQCAFAIVVQVYLQLVGSNVTPASAAQAAALSQDWLQSDV